MFCQYVLFIVFWRLYYLFIIVRIYSWLLLIKIRQLSRLIISLNFVHFEIEAAAIEI